MLSQPIRAAWIEILLKATGLSQPQGRSPFGLRGLKSHLQRHAF